MDSSILADRRLYDFLFSVDRDLAEGIRGEGCRCGCRFSRPWDPCFSEAFPPPGPRLA